jgi:hypothetical protein
MKYKFKVGELVRREHTGDLGLVTDRIDASALSSAGDGKYTILIGSDTIEVWEYELRKVGK